MKLLTDMIAKANKVKDLLEIECRDDAERTLLDMEVMLNELPGAVEDWAHMLLEESSHFAEARAWIHKDKFRALSQIEAGIDRLEEINQIAQGYGVAPEDKEDLDG